MSPIMSLLLGGLGGAIILALVTVSVWWLQRQQQRRENKAAARLVWMEITSNIGALNAGMSISPPQLVVEDAAWRAHAAAVANLLDGAALAQVAVPYAMLPSARLALSEVNFQETIRARLHGTDYETLRTLKERFVEAERSLRYPVWPRDVGKRLAEALASQEPSPRPHSRRARLRAVALTIGLERVTAAVGWTQLLIRLDYLIERTAIRPAKPWWPRRLAAWLARWVWTRLTERLWPPRGQNSPRLDPWTDGGHSLRLRESPREARRLSNRRRAGPGYIQLPLILGLRCCCGSNVEAGAPSPPMLAS